MTNLLSTITIILILAAAFTKLSDVFVSEQTKNVIKEKIEGLWITLDDRNPVIIIQAPLVFLAASYNILFGNRCFSKMAITRSATISLTLLIVALSITGLFTGTPFGMKTYPWGYFDNAINSEKLIYDTSQKDSAKKDEKSVIPSNEYSKQRWEYISQFSNTKWRMIYSVFFILFVLVVNAIVDTISFSISRLMLNEMIQTKSIVLLLSVFFINILISVFLATIVLFLSVLLCLPSVGGTAITLVIKLLLNYPSWTSIGLFAAAIGAWNLSGGWLKVLALTTVFPSLVFCCAIFISILTNPIKDRVHRLIKIIILKSIEHDKGVFAFFTILFTTAGALIGGLVKFFGS